MATKKKYHINPGTGEPGICTATQRCPFGDLATEHYSSPEAAREAYEKQASQSPMVSVSKKDWQKVASGEVTPEVRQAIVNFAETHLPVLNAMEPSEFAFKKNALALNAAYSDAKVLNNDEAQEWIRNNLAYSLANSNGILVSDIRDRFKRITDDFTKDEIRDVLMSKTPDETASWCYHLGWKQPRSVGFSNWRSRRKQKSNEALALLMGAKYGTSRDISNIASKSGRGSRRY